MIIITAGCIHIAPKGPESRVDNYLDSVCKKLEQIVDYANDVHADYLIELGDLFDTPIVPEVTMGRAFRILRKAKMPILGILGSHDHYGYQKLTVERTAIGVAEAAGLLKLVSGRVRLSSDVIGYFVPHTIEADKSLDLYKVPKSKRIQLLFCHSAVVPKPFFNDYLLTKDIVKVTNAQLIVSAHIHSPFEVKYKKVKFVNGGSVARCNREETHQPGFLHIEVLEEVHYKRVLLDCAEKVFKKKETAVAEHQEVDLKKFFSSLKAYEIKSINIMDAVRKSNLSDAHKELATDYVRRLK